MAVLLLPLVGAGILLGMGFFLSFLDRAIFLQKTLGCATVGTAIIILLSLVCDKKTPRFHRILWTILWSIILVTCIIDILMLR